MNLLLVNGGARKISRTRGLTKAFEAALKEKGVTVNVFDVGIDMLPIFTGTEEDREAASVQKLTAYAREADGFVICTPEYHNGMSGALKNALDFLGGTHFRGKPVVIGATCGGGKGGINALNNLRIVMRGVYGNVLPDQIVVDPDHFDQQLQLVNYDMQERISQIANELVKMTGLMKSSGLSTLT